MRSSEEVCRVRRLAREGANASEISRLTGIPRSTVRDWLAGACNPVQRMDRCNVCGQPQHDFKRLPGDAYAYLLGLYLGDGVISRARRGVYRLRIKMDSRYPGIVAECAAAMRAVMPSNRVGVQEIRERQCVEIGSYSRAWPCLFPQHGPGRKHARRIVLALWQQNIVERQPEMFLRGLIHSDGCRVLNRVNGRSYPRYFFSQVSTDIKELFCRSCDSLGITYTAPYWKTVSVARAESVARLDTFVGPKA